MGIGGIGPLLDERGIALGMAARGKRSALTRIAEHMAGGADMGGRSVLAALLRRERLGSTGIGHGVAVPHALLETITRPVASLVTLEAPVWYDAPDGEPVDLLVALLWPRADMAGFLPMLSRVCRQLRAPALRESLRAARTAAEVLVLLGAARLAASPAPDSAPRYCEQLSS